MVDDSVEAAALEAVGKLGQLQGGQHVQEAGLGIGKAAATDEADGKQKLEQLHRPSEFEKRLEEIWKLFGFVFFFSFSLNSKLLKRNGRGLLTLVRRLKIH